LCVENSSPIEQVIQSGVVPRFVEFLFRDDLPQLQYCLFQICLYLLEVYVVVVLIVCLWLCWFSLKLLGHFQT